MEVVRIEGLPDDPLSAAAHFHAAIASGLAERQGDIVLVFASSDHLNRGWRVAAVQALARAVAPRRFNAVAGGTADAVESAIAYLKSAAGVTGHYLVLDGAGAGPVLASTA